MITHASLCTGYGGLDTAAAFGLGELDTLWHAEVDPDANAVLDRRRPFVPNLGDITTTDWTTIARTFGRPHLMSMGPPCQPVSAAGRQLAENDARWLWPACRTAIAALRPAVIFFENVRNLLAIQKGAIWAGILADLRDLGYAVRWTVLGACRVGAPHHRHRIFLLATLADGSAPPAVRVDTPQCGAPRNGGRLLLPTPTARDGQDATGRVRGEGTPEYWRNRIETTGRTNGLPLGAAVRLLSGDGKLLPTPQASDHKGANPLSRDRDGRARPSTDDDLPTSMLRLAGRLLPTPNASDAQGGPRELPAVRTHRGGTDHGPRLRDVGATLLPTPQARDGDDRRGAPQPDLAAARLASGRRNLPDAIAASGRLLPTPQGSDAKNGGPNQGIASGDVALSSAVIGERWGEYAGAVALWQELHGPVPEPVESNGRGTGVRLASALPEWMMGLPSGFLTDVVGRGGSLRLAGNGVMPAQGAAALEILLAP